MFTDEFEQLVAIGGISGKPLRKRLTIENGRGLLSNSALTEEQQQQHDSSYSAHDKLLTA